MEQLVDELEREGAIHSSSVEEAFKSIPRHLFIHQLPPYLTPTDQGWTPFDPSQPSEEALDQIYQTNTAIQLKPAGPPASSSAPNIMTIMLEALEMSHKMTVLEIGTGSGYNAALLAHLIGHPKGVYTVDNQPEVSQQAEINLNRALMQGINLICADGGNGYPPNAPYNRIIATTSVYDIPPAWVDQLADGGIMVVPVWMAPGQMPIAKFVKQDNILSGSFITEAGFMAMHGAFGYEELGCILRAKENAALAQVLEQPVTAAIDFPLVFEDKADQFRQCMAFNVYVNLIESRATGLQAAKWSSLALWDKGASSLVAAWYPNWELGVYGNRLMYNRLLNLLDQWEILGAPEIPLYQIRIYPKGEHCYSQEPTLFNQCRSWHQWEWCLPNSASKADNAS